MAGIIRTSKSGRYDWIIETIEKSNKDRIEHPRDTRERFKPKDTKDAKR